MADYAIVHMARCEECEFGTCPAPPVPHSWMGKEDAEHAGLPWPPTSEQERAHPCACACTGGPGHVRTFPGEEMSRA